MSWILMLDDLLGLAVSLLGFRLASSRRMRWMVWTPLAIIWLTVTVMGLGIGLADGFVSPQSMSMHPYWTTGLLSITLLVQAILSRLNRDSGWRDDVACDMADFALTHIATGHYRIIPDDRMHPIKIGHMREDGQ